MKVSVLRSATTAVVLALLIQGCTLFPWVPARSGETARSEVPRLVVVDDCAECSLPREFATVLQAGYEEAARETGARISAVEQAIVTVTRYSVRNTFVLVIAGPLALAWPDEIAGELRVDGRVVKVAYGSRNIIPFGRVDSLVRTFGARTFEAVLHAEPDVDGSASIPDEPRRGITVSASSLASCCGLAARSTETGEHPQSFTHTHATP